MKPKQDSEMSQPVLSGAWVQLRPLLSDDREKLYAVASDPLIWEQHPAQRFQRPEFNRFFDESLASGGAVLVLDAGSGAVIGSSRYFGYREAESSIEIGWTFLVRSHWGGKYNGDLKRLMLEHAFEYVDWVVFYIDPNNRRSQRSVEKIGGIRDQRPDPKGRSVFRIAKSAYLPGHCS